MGLILGTVMSYLDTYRGTCESEIKKIGSLTGSCAKVAAYYCE